MKLMRGCIPCFATLGLASFTPGSGCPRFWLVRVIPRHLAGPDQTVHRTHTHVTLLPPTPARSSQPSISLPSLHTTVNTHHSIPSISLYFSSLFTSLLATCIPLSRQTSPVNNNNNTPILDAMTRSKFKDEHPFGTSAPAPSRRRGTPRATLATMPAGRDVCASPAAWARSCNQPVCTASERPFDAHHADMISYLHRSHRLIVAALHCITSHRC